MCVSARVLFAVGLAAGMAAATWALVHFLFQVRSTANTATRAFDTASFHSGISGKAQTLGRVAGGEAYAKGVSEGAASPDPGAARSGVGSVGDDGDGDGRRTKSQPDEPRSFTARSSGPRDQGLRRSLPRGVYSSSSSALSPDPSLQVCSPGAAYSDFLFALGHEHSAAEDCGILGSFVSPSEYSKGRLLPRHHFVGGGRDGATLSQFGAKYGWEPQWETDSRLLDFQLGLHAPAEGGRLVAVTSGVRRHELRRWCRELHHSNALHKDIDKDSDHVWSSSVIDLFGIEGDREARSRVGQGVLRFLPWSYEGVYGGALEKPSALPATRGAGRQRGVSRKARRKAKEKRDNEPKGEAANSRAEHSVQGNAKPGRATAISIEPGGDQVAVPDLQDTALGTGMANPGDDDNAEAQSLDGHSEDADEDDEDGTIVTVLNAQTDNVDAPLQEQAASAVPDTRAAASPDRTPTTRVPSRTFLETFRVWWFWRSKLLFSWILPGIFTDPEEVVESMRAHSRAQADRFAESSSPSSTSLHSRLNMKLVSPLLSDASSGGFPAYDSLFGRSLYGDTVFPESAMLFGQRDRLLHLTRSRRALPPLWPLLLAKSPVLHRFHSEATMTLLSHRYTVSALPSPRIQAGAWSRPGSFYTMSHIQNLFATAMSGGGISGSGGDVAMLSHALYGNTISVWINVSFVVGKDSASSQPKSRASADASTAHGSQRTGRGWGEARAHGGFTRGDGFYSIDGIAQDVLRDVGSVLLDASVLRIRKCANPTASNQRRWREVLWWMVAPEDRWGREACPGRSSSSREAKSRNAKARVGQMWGGRQARGLEWEERIRIPGHAAGDDDEDGNREGERQGVSNFWVDPSPVDRFFQELHPRARVSAILLQKDPDTGAQDVFDARNCGPACSAIWPSVDADEREEDMYGLEPSKIGLHRRKRRRKRKSPSRTRQRQSLELTLWQLRRFVAVWREMVDRPEHFDQALLKTDASRRLTGMRSVSTNDRGVRKPGRSRNDEVVFGTPRIVGVRASVPLVYGKHSQTQRQSLFPLYYELMQSTLSAMMAFCMWAGNVTWYIASFLTSTIHGLFQEPHRRNANQGQASGFSSNDSPSSASDSSNSRTSVDSLPYTVPPCEMKSPELGFWSSDGDFGMSGSTFSPPNVTCHYWEVLPVAGTTCVIVSVPQLPSLAALINTFAISVFVTALIAVFVSYLVFSHVLLGTMARHGWGVPSWVRTLSVTTHFTLVYFAPNFDQNGRSDGTSASAVGGLETRTTNATGNRTTNIGQGANHTNAATAESANGQAESSSVASTGNTPGEAASGVQVPAGSSREQLIRQFSSATSGTDDAGS